MNVSCPECQSTYRVDPAKLPGPGVRARCSVCGGIIPIVTSGSWTDELGTAQQHAGAGAPASAAASHAGQASRAWAPTPVYRPDDGPLPPIPESPRPPQAAPPPPAPEPPARRPAAAAPPAAPQAPTGGAGRPTPPRVPPFSPGRRGTPIAVPAIEREPRPAEPPAAASAAPVAPPPPAAPRPSAPPPPPAPAPSAPAPPPAPAAVAPPPAPRPAAPPPPPPLPPAAEVLAAAAPPAPAAPPPSAPAAQPPRAAAPAPAAPSSAPAGTAKPAEGRAPINPFLANDPNQKAKRLARALVSDMVAYHPQKREEGLRNGTLKQLFREEIKKSYEEYVEQMGQAFAESTTHFQDALNDVLAGGKKIF